MLPAAAAAQAGLGGDHPQEPGYVPRRGGGAGAPTLVHNTIPTPHPPAIYSYHAISPAVYHATTPAIYHPPDHGLLRRGHGLRRHLARQIARRPSLPPAVPRQSQLRWMRQVTAAPSPRPQPYSRRCSPAINTHHIACEPYHQAKASATPGAVATSRRLTCVPTAR